MYISRHLEDTLLSYLDFFPVVGIIGPRQSGKTTLVKNISGKIGKPINYLDLEKTSDLRKLEEPEIYLKQNEDKLIIIDEVQRKQELFSLIRAMVDQKRIPGRFLILGSASPELLKQTSESLAGRIGYLELHPFHLLEIKDIFSLERLWVSGGFPPAILSKDNTLSGIWMNNFIKTYTERDLPYLGFPAPALQTERFLMMLANSQGQILNYSQFSNSMGLSSHTIKSYIDFLEHSFLVKRLYPWSFNINKRLVKSPKIYIRDSGMLHSLMGIANMDELFGHVIIGNSWEGFVYQQILLSIGNNYSLYFYRSHAGSEIDLVFVKGAEPVMTAEIKYSNSPKLTKGNISAIHDLKCKENYIITPSSDDYPVKEDIQVCSLERFVNRYLPLS